MPEDSLSRIRCPIALLGRAVVQVFDLNVFECRNALSDKKKGAIAAHARAADIVTLQEDVDCCGPLVFRDHRLIAYAEAGRLRNSIFLHRSIDVSGPIGPQDLVISSGDDAEDRSAAAVILESPSGRRATLATTHLVGGRYDDARAKLLRDARQAQLERLLEQTHPDVIVGDYNSFPEDLYANYERRIMAYAAGIGSPDPRVLRQYMTSGHAFLERSGFVRARYEDESSAQTNARGHTIVDWVYYRPEQVEVGNPCIVKMYDESSSWPEEPETPGMLSDHHAIRFDLRLGGL